MAQINPRTFADAKQLADNVYELILTNWGNRGRLQDPNNGSIQYPPVKNIPGTVEPFLPEGAIPIVSDFLLPPIPSLFGIAIAPRSDVDMCILNFPSLPQVPAEDTGTTIGAGGTVDAATRKSITIPQGFVNYGGWTESEQFLSVHAPLIGQLPGPVLIRASYHGYFDDTYTPLDPAGTTRFGLALNDPTQATRGFFKTPELRLLLYMTSKSVLPPTKRAPFYDNGVLLGVYPLGGTWPPWVYPCMGRRIVRLNLRNTSATEAITFTVEGVTPQRRAVPYGASISYNGEAYLLGQVTVAAASSTSLIIEQPGAPYLTLTASGSVGFPPGAIEFNISMFD